MKLPSVSVIIPAYNYAQFLPDCIESCLAQEYDGDVEIIVVDDASTDNTYHVMRSMFKSILGSPRLQMLRQKRNMGYSRAKNDGIAASKGEIIVTLDADDMLTPGSLTYRCGYLARYPQIMMCHGRAYGIKGEGGYEYWVKRIYKLGVCAGKKKHAQTVTFRREIFVKFGLFCEDLRSRSDKFQWMMWENVCGIGGMIDFMGEQPVAFYRRHPDTMIQYRKKHPAYNAEQTRIMEQKFHQLKCEGLRRDNYRFLKR